MNEIKKNIPVAYLGDAYSYHHIAAMEYFGNDRTFAGFTSFQNIIDALQSSTADSAVLAVENSLAGDVPGNYERIAQNHLFIYGEIFLHIQLQLAALSGTDINAIKFVYSHPMAIRETSDFFSRYPHIRLVETDSTATALKKVALDGRRDQAAIGSSAAAQYYKLEKLAGRIDNNTGNITRFLVVGSKKTEAETTNSGVLASLLLRSQISENSFEHTLLPRDGFQLFRKLSSGNVYIEIAANKQAEIAEKIGVIEETSGPVDVLGIYPKGRTIAA